jgi:ATP-dependent Clp protease ATP-binding subunit ClpA
VEAGDMLLALFDGPQGVPVAILRRFGVEPDVLTSRLEAHFRERELRQERLKKRFDLPPHVDQFTTNLNRLACLDKLPPVFGRDREIRQVLEILSHRERSNSVMLVGEPGVGKTAIAEGLARRIEFEPETIPVRLRDAQILSLQMNVLVSGTMLRGMFEERLHHLIRELKERPNLILFVDEAHTLIGAGSAMGAPSDAAQVFKSVLARGEVRMIAATTLSEYKQHVEEDEALARRFRCVRVPEPTIEETRRILYQLRPRLERNYSVELLDEALDTDKVQGEISRELERHFAPEFRNRIDDVIVFAPLTTDDVRRITRGYLLELERTMAKTGRTLEIDDDAVELIVAEGYSMAFGARFLKRVIDERIKLPITLHWNDGLHFRVRVAQHAIQVDALREGSIADDEPDAYRDVA